MSRRCADCRNGEHDNYDEDIDLVVITDPTSPSTPPRRAYICGLHHAMYIDDGYNVRILTPAHA